MLIDSQKQNNTWLENLVKEFLHVNEKQSNDEKKKSQEQRKEILKAIRDIINELVESILKIESSNDQVRSSLPVFGCFNSFLPSRFPRIKWSLPSSLSMP